MMLKKHDSKKFKILVRGDCTSRRSIYLNRDLFPSEFTLIQNQKSPAIFFMDAVGGSTVEVEFLERISLTEKMPDILKQYYLGQSDRSIILEEDADLVIMDNYAEMNFDIWEPKDGGAKFWIHPKYIKDQAWFYENYRNLGKRNFNQSVEDFKRLIEYLTARNPNAKFLILNQQVEYYKKLHSRIEFYNLGAEVSKGVHGLYRAPALLKENLLMADIGSCGEGQTLHFQAETYRNMLQLSGINFIKNEEINFSIEPNKNFYAKDNAEKIKYKEIAVNFGFNTNMCLGICSALQELKIKKNLSNYIYIDDVTETLKWTPAVIERSNILDFGKWLTDVNKTYNRRYLMNRSKSKGYSFKEFNPKLFIPDIWEINNSTELRSGGSMRGSYLKSIEELGGAPDRMYLPISPKCKLHWSKTFGIFAPDPGYFQGNQTVNERLLAYISIRRIGDIALYTQVMGHKDYLNDGIMYHLHFEIVRLLSTENNDWNSLIVLMYGGVGNGGKSLWQWKNKVGFAPCILKNIQ